MEEKTEADPQKPVRTALVFDIDGTLTAHRQPIDQVMADILINLSVPFFVAAGSSFEMLKGQFFEPLYELGFRGQFDAFISNGAIQFHCDYSQNMSIEFESEFNLRDELGENDYAFLLDKLAETLNMDDLQLPPSLDVVENRIVDRVSMINLCPMGRLNREDAAAQKNRDAFVAFDATNNYRLGILNHLNHELSDLIASKQLKITLGGQTSFDIGIVGQDKTKPIRMLLDDGFKKIIFIGDALFEGGNDAAIAEFIEKWPSDSKCPVLAEQVDKPYITAKNGPKKPTTIGVLRELKLL